MENWLTTTSNLYGLIAASAWRAGSLGQVLTLFAVLFSIIYHSIETRKHDMPGIRPFATGSEHQHKICLNLDRTAALSLGLYLTYVVLCSGQWSVLLEGFLAISLNALSELFRWTSLGNLSTRQKTWWYVVFHSLWHIAAFHMSWILARNGN
jgi:hypothetical protein